MTERSSLLPFSLGQGPGVISPINHQSRSSAARRFISLAREKGSPPKSSSVDMMTNMANLGWWRFLEYTISSCRVTLHWLMQGPCRRWECLNAFITWHHDIGNTLQWFFFPVKKRALNLKIWITLSASLKSIFFAWGGGRDQSFLLLIFLFFLARLIFRAWSDGLYFTRWRGFPEVQCRAH